MEDPATLDTHCPETPAHEGYGDLINLAAPVEPVATIVAHPCDEMSLTGVVRAWEDKLIEPVLVGPEARIRAAADAAKIDISALEIVSTPHSHASAETAVELIRAGRGEILKKGSLHTDELMQAVVSKTNGLRTERRVSHVFAMDVPSYHKPLFVTDGAINIAPDLEEKRDIIQNAIELAHALDIPNPKVAILSAVETVTSAIPTTIEAAALCKMADRKQITGGRLDGPLAMDNAISPEAVRIKGIESEVAGDADILVAPDLEAGNMLAKNLIFMSGADSAGIVLGARVPIVLTSRADSVSSRIASCAMAALLATAKRQALVAQ